MSKLPLLWPFIYEDKRTWKYKDCIVGGKKENGNLYIKQWIINEDFMFKHLDKGASK